jgi:glucokinase
MSRFIVAADVGGTKVSLGLFEASGPDLRLVAEKSYVSAHYPGPGPIITDFLSKVDRRVDALGLGVAGPVEDGRVQMPNLPWIVDAEVFRKAVDPVFVVNDLAATARALPHLPLEKFVSLTPDLEPAPGNACLLAPGTGLGEAVLFWDGQKFVPSASEGGHADFAPRNQIERDLFKFLAAEYGHVSYERVASGPGLHNVYRFLLAQGEGDEPDVLANSSGEEDPSAAIAVLALAGSSRRCREALDIFVRVLGAEAGNLALKSLARGGVFLGGGIPPKILPILQDGPFLESFRDKGRMTPLMSRIPVRVVTAPEAALWGAAWHALDHLES